MYGNARARQPVVPRVEASGEFSGEFRGRDGN
jgi:hypothetical protein